MLYSDFQKILLLQNKVLSLSICHIMIVVIHMQLFKSFFIFFFEKQDIPWSLYLSHELMLCCTFSLTGQKR